MRLLRRVLWQFSTPSTLNRHQRCLHEMATVVCSCSRSCSCGAGGAGSASDCGGSGGGAATDAAVWWLEDFWVWVFGMAMGLFYQRLLLLLLMILLFFLCTSYWVIFDLHSSWCASRCWAAMNCILIRFMISGGVPDGLLERTHCIPKLAFDWTLTFSSQI